MTEKRTTVNRPLLLETLAHIEAHPEDWDQESWAVLHPTREYRPDKLCGTSLCFAGHALVREGLVPFLDKGAVQNVVDYGDEDQSTTQFIPVKNAAKLAKAIKKAGDFESVSFLDYVPYSVRYDVRLTAAERLGLTESQADRLFDGDNSITEIRALVSEYLTIDDTLQAKALAKEKGR